MSNLTACSAYTVYNLAISDYAAADSRTKRHTYDILRAFSSALPHFTDSRNICIIIHNNRKPCFYFKQILERVILPSKINSLVNQASCHMYWSRSSHTKSC
ncbi:hypothetical protein D3C84_1019590 [compost metagenome]